MNIIHESPKLIIVVKEPQCRVVRFSDGGLNSLLNPRCHFFLSLPYMVHAITRDFTYSQVCLACSPEPIKNMDDPVYGVPLPNMQNSGPVCGITGINYPKDTNKTIHSILQVLYGSTWTHPNDYDWIMQYQRDFGFINQLLELNGKQKTHRSTGKWPSNGRRIRILDGPMDMFHLWAAASKKDPNFILKMPFIKHEYFYQNLYYL